jgi:hypothetical protein
MHLTIRQRSNIRHFIYYLVNGTLSFELLHNHLSVPYHDFLKTHPELFYKTCCVFINQQMMLDPSWPQVKRLAEFICKEVDPSKNKDLDEFKAWELNFEIGALDVAGSFKSFTKWFIASTVVDEINYTNYIEDGATFVEQCFAIWANVIQFEKERAINYDHALSRVEEYIKFNNGVIKETNLKDWEWELHME